MPRLPNSLSLEQTPVWLRLPNTSCCWGKSPEELLAGSLPQCPSCLTRFFLWQEEGKSNMCHEPLKTLLLLAWWGS